MELGPLATLAVILALLALACRFVRKHGTCPGCKGGRSGCRGGCNLRRPAAAAKPRPPAEAKASPPPRSSADRPDPVRPPPQPRNNQT